jgi:hypothetical protein
MRRTTDAAIQRRLLLHGFGSKERLFRDYLSVERADRTTESRSPTSIMCDGAAFTSPLCHIVGVADIGRLRVRAARNNLKYRHSVGGSRLRFQI